MFGIPAKSKAPGLTLLATPVQESEVRSRLRAAREELRKASAEVDQAKKPLVLLDAVLQAEREALEALQAHDAAEVLNLRGAIQRGLAAPEADIVKRKALAAECEAAQVQGNHARSISSEVHQAINAKTRIAAEIAARLPELEAHALLEFADAIAREYEQALAQAAEAYAKLQGIDAVIAEQFAGVVVCDGAGRREVSICSGPGRAGYFAAPGALLESLAYEPTLSVPVPGDAVSQGADAARKHLSELRV